MTWERRTHWEEVWGTVVTFEVRDRHIEEESLHSATSEAVGFLHHVDDVFSTYKPTSIISLVRAGVLTETEARSPDYVEVVKACRDMKALTGGRFDPWAVPDGVDFSGFVKGWAAQAVAAIFKQHGFANTSINAAGDVWCAGFQAPEHPWTVGIQHPFDNNSIMKTVHASDQAVCTSGTYRKGFHIIDPRTQGPATSSIVSATVLGPAGGTADALASALVVNGVDGRSWFAGLPGWSAVIVTDTHEVFTW
ncbi:MAG: FAD:protein FMN transferase [Actinomycetes bacterium]